MFYLCSIVSHIGSVYAGAVIIIVLQIIVLQCLTIMFYLSLLTVSPEWRCVCWCCDNNSTSNYSITMSNHHVLSLPTYSFTRVALCMLVLHYTVEFVFHAARLLYFADKTELANTG